MEELTLYINIIYMDNGDLIDIYGRSHIWKISYMEDPIYGHIWKIT